MLDFDESRLAHFDRRSAQKALAEQADAFRAQLVAAHWIEGWRERLEQRPPREESEDWCRGVVFAMREVVAHLRQGDLISGGLLYRETTEDLTARGAATERDADDS